jgi:hypothetical protein
MLLLLPVAASAVLVLPAGLASDLSELDVLTSAVLLLPLDVKEFLAMLLLLAASANAGPVGIAGWRLADLPPSSQLPLLLLLPLRLLLLAMPNVQLATPPAAAVDGIPRPAAQPPFCCCCCCWCWCC